MNAIDKFSGAESAARILGARRWETMECGHGHCAASVPCTGACKLKDAIVGLPVLDTMTDDRFNLHRPVVDGKTGLIVSHVDTSAMDRKDCMSFGGLDHLPVEMIEPIPSVMRDAYVLKTIALGGALLAVIVGVLYVSTL